MGEMAEMLFDGTMCEQCGQLAIEEGEDPPGHPQLCRGCKNEGVTTLGQIAFEAYNKDRGGVNHQGNKTPDWGDLPEEIQHAWEVGADEVAIELLHGMVGRRTAIKSRTVDVELTAEERAASGESGD